MKRTPEGLIGPPLPERVAYLWDAFLDIHAGRSYGMNGPNPLSWSDIAAWNELFSMGLKDWEVRVIKTLDLLWLRVMSEDETHG